MQPSLDRVTNEECQVRTRDGRPVLHRDVVITVDFLTRDQFAWKRKIPEANRTNRFPMIHFNCAPICFAESFPGINFQAG